LEVLDKKLKQRQGRGGKRKKGEGGTTSKIRVWGD